MPDLRQKVVDVCRILYVEGHADMSLGHASGRDPGAQTIFLKPRLLGFEEVVVDDVVEMDLEGNQISGRVGPPGEWPLHTEIYKVRPDVNGIVHSHPLWTTLFGITGLPFQPVNQDAVMFYKGLKVFTGTPELLTTKEMGAELAAQFGEGNAIIMPNHGAVIVGSSIEEALLLSLNLEKALQAQLMVHAFGGARNVIDPAMAAKMGEKLLAQTKRTMDLYGYSGRKANRILGA
jgi:L-fuculose-phosphate aldolase